MPTAVNILIVSMNQETQGNRCLLQLDNIWIQQGGKWWSQPPGAFGGDKGAGTWVRSPDDINSIEAAAGTWILNGLINPLSAGQKGTGRHFLPGRFVGYGDIAWKIFSINVEAPNWESEELDISDFLAASSDGS